MGARGGEEFNSTERKTNHTPTILLPVYRYNEWDNKCGKISWGKTQVMFNRFLSILLVIVQSSILFPAPHIPHHYPFK